MRLATRAISGRNGGFTLAEVMAALVFLAIVIPVAVEVLHLASLAGAVSARKGAAARIADRILNESLVTTNWMNVQSGTASEGLMDFQWSLANQVWIGDPAMQLVTVEVKFTAQGRDFSVRLNTLAAQPNAVAAQLNSSQPPPPLESTQ